MRVRGAVAAAALLLGATAIGARAAEPVAGHSTERRAPRPQYGTTTARAHDRRIAAASGAARAAIPASGGAGVPPRLQYAVEIGAARHRFGARIIGGPRAAVLGAGGPPQVQYGASAAIDQHHSVAPIITPTRADGRPVSTPLLAPADTTTTAYDVGGVRVIQRRVTANDVVAANLYLLGGTRQATPETVGTETLLLELSERGTRAYPRDVLRAKMARLGSAIVVEPAQDWTMLGLRATTSGFDSTWAIFADRVMRPRLDSTEMEVVREQLASAARQRRESPDALLEALADSVAFAGHPYALPPAGTERSIAAITVGDLRRYQATQMVKSRMLLVVVGNVERPRLERLVRSTLATLPAGSYRWTLPDSLPARPAALAIEARSLPTNYLLGYYTGPAAGSGDYQALRIAAAALSGRLFTEIRSRRNLTYAVNAPFVDRAISAGGLYVTTVSPDTTLALMRTEIANLQRELVPAEGLERLVQQFITEYFLDNETNSDQATFLARAQLYRGDYRTAERFVDELHAVTPDDVRRVARLYMRNVSFAYIGDPQRLTKRYVQF